MLNPIKVGTCILAASLLGCTSEVAAPKDVRVDWNAPARAQFPVVRPVTTWHFVVDTEATEEQFTEVVRALEDWSAKVTCQFTYYIDRRPTLQFIPQDLPNYLPETDTIEIRFGETPEGPAQQGWAHWEKTERAGRVVTYGAWLIIRPDLGPMTGRVVRHEIGHALFLDHDLTPGVTMNPDVWEQPASVTPQDAANYDSTWCG